MMEQPTAMHVVRIKSRHTDRQGRERVYESRLLRRTYREGGTVRNETLANLSKLPDRIVTACGTGVPATRRRFPDYTPKSFSGSRARSGTRFLLGDPLTSD